jgi:hypothetical protein
LIANSSWRLSGDWVFSLHSSSYYGQQYLYLWINETIFFKGPRQMNNLEKDER